MTEYDSPAPEISQQQIEDLLGLVEVVKKSPFVTDYPFYLPGIYVNASTQEAAVNNNSGHIVVEDNPNLDPTSFLGIRYIENGYKFETERFFAFYKDSEGKISFKASALIDHNETNHKIADPTSADEELAEAFGWEDLQFRASLKDAEIEDYKTLKELLEFGLNGNEHDTRTDEQKAMDEEYRRSLLSRRQKAALAIRKLFRL